MNGETRREAVTVDLVGIPGLYIAVDADTGRILAEDLTRSGVHNTVPAPAGLKRVAGHLGCVYGDGAHAGGPLYRAVAGRREALAVVRR